MEAELKQFAPDAPDALPEWSISRFGFLSWSVIEARCRANPDQWSRTLACFEWNREQIYRAAPSVAVARLQIGSVCELGTELFVVVGWSDKNCRVIPASRTNGFFPASKLVPSQRLIPSGHVLPRTELDHRRPQAGTEYSWDPELGEAIQPPNRAPVPAPPRLVRVTASGWNTCAVRIGDGDRDGLQGAFHVFTRHIRP